MAFNYNIMAIIFQLSCAKKIDTASLVVFEKHKMWFLLTSRNDHLQHHFNS